MVGAPELKEASVAEGNVIGMVHGEKNGHPVNPFRFAFKLGKVADGRFIHDAVAAAVAPLGAPFLIAEGGNQPDGSEDLGKVVAVANFCFRFNAMLVRVFSGTAIGKALVGERAAAGVVADAKNLRAGAHLAVGGVVENVGLEGARSLQDEARGEQTPGEGLKVVDAEFNLGFYRHDTE